jgi:hypothetical protein
LEIIWVQIRGVPPKWSNWKCFRQIASSIGKMLEIDWTSLFSSFFSMVRVKIACKDPTKILGKRLFEMENNFSIIHFKVENALELGTNDGNDNGKDDEDGDNADDYGMEELQHDSEPEESRSAKGNGQDKVGPGQGMCGSSVFGGRTNGGKKVATWTSLFQTDEENFGLENS